MQLENYDKIVCVNLKSRPDRLLAFNEGLPDEFKDKVVIFDAIDGNKLDLPDWWPGGHSGYGCYLSHKRIVEDAIQEDLDNILILEDDAKFVPDFYNKFVEFNKELPEDAEYVLYGGQLSYASAYPPEKVSEHVIRAFSVERTHAYALIGKPILKKVHKHLCDVDWHRGHVDSRLTLLQHTLQTCYVPDRWLVEQRESYSDLMKRDIHYNFDDPINSIGIDK